MTFTATRKLMLFRQRCDRLMGLVPSKADDAAETILDSPEASNAEKYVALSYLRNQNRSWTITTSTLATGMLTTIACILTGASWSLIALLLSIGGVTATAITMSTRTLPPWQRRLRQTAWVAETLRIAIALRFLVM